MGGALSVMLIVDGNRIGDPCSNPRRACFLVHAKKNMNLSVLSALALVWQPIWENENCEFKTTLTHLKIDILHEAKDFGKYILIDIGVSEDQRSYGVYPFF